MYNRKIFGRHWTVWPRETRPWTEIIKNHVKQIINTYFTNWARFGGGERRYQAVTVGKTIVQSDSQLISKLKVIVLD